MQRTKYQWGAIMYNINRKFRMLGEIYEGKKIENRRNTGYFLSRNYKD